MIHVITVKNNVVDEVRTFANIDEQDTSGAVEAEKVFEEKIMELVKEDIDDIERYTEDGYFEIIDSLGNKTTVSLVHSEIENIQM